MKSPFLSIITINYNDLEGLKATVRSVLEQTFSDFEYILIDGGSNDGSREFIEENQQHFSFFTSEPDRGIYHAMNKGISLATGQYYLFLNSGDTLASREILDEFTGHSNFGGDIIYGNYKFDEGFKEYPDRLYPGYFMKTSLPHQSTLFHNKVFELMGLYKESYPMCADRAFFLECYLDGRFVFRHLPLALTKFDLSGISNDPEFLEEKRSEDLRMLKEIYGQDYDRYRQELDLELRKKKIPKYSPRGIWKRIKKRIREL